MRAFAVAVLLGLGLVVATSTAASAATITEPAGKKVEIGVARDGFAAPITVTASGFEPYSSVFIEMCNGRTPTDDNWTPTIDCDLGSAPAAAVADEKGVVTFAADDPNHALFPFVGPGPQTLFNCLAAGAASPGNGMDDFTDCQLRVSTSNNEATDDQVFVTLALPAAAKTGWGSPVFPKPVGSGGEQAGSARQSVNGSERSSKAGANAATTDGSSTASTPSGSSSSSDGFPVLPVVLSIVVVAGGAATVLVLHKRRSGRVAA